MSEAIAALFRPEVSPLARRRGFSALRRLGPHWLRDEVLDEIGATAPPRLALEAGEFIVLLHRAVPSPVIHEGFALPLRWRAGRGEDPRLPHELASLAHGIDGGERTHALWLGEGCPDLSTVSIPAASAGAMLRASLEAARGDLEIDDLVTASATWGGADLGPVEGLSAKLDAARRLGIPRVFVSKFQHPLPDPCAVPTTPLEGRNAEQQLHGLLLALDAPPGAGTLDARIAWYERHAGHPAERTRAGEFFCGAVAMPLAEACRRRAPSGDGAPTVLVAIASGSFESAAFAACVHRPERVLLLHEPGAEGERLVARTRRALDLCLPTIVVETAPLPESGQDFAPYATELEARLRTALGVPHGAIASAWMDLTGGTTMMKAAALMAGRRCGLRLSCVDKRDDPERRVPLVRTNRIVEISEVPRSERETRRDAS